MTQAESVSVGSNGLLAGAAVAVITPDVAVYLHGYPHCERVSESVSDELECNALWLESEGRAVLTLACDLLYVSRSFVRRVRQGIATLLPIDSTAILITATHTHSGPVVLSLALEANDPHVPPPNGHYLHWLEETMVRVAGRAYQLRRPATLAWATADATGIGTNRHDRNGPSDLAVPVLTVRARDTHELIGVSIVCTMHPTVLHEDSRAISGDFLGLARGALRRQLGEALPIAIHVGACGDQSPRHVVFSNTLDEARRLAAILADAAEATVKGSSDSRDCRIEFASGDIALKVRDLPGVAEAEASVADAREQVARLVAEGAPRTAVRTAECDVFGAESTCDLAALRDAGRLQGLLENARVAEVMVIRIGPRRLIAWPGEWFVDYQLAMKADHPDAIVVTMANGELQGYVVTEQALRERWYEAGNAVFDFRDTASRVLDLTNQLLASVE